LLGVTSIVRALKLRPVLYNKLRDSLHSNAVQLDQLSALKRPGFVGDRRVWRYAARAANACFRL
jgi:hypothetical protein